MSFKLTPEAAALLGSLGLSARLQDMPATIVALARLVADLQQRVESLERRKK
jgi:hypothetical protein